MAEDSADIKQPSADKSLDRWGWLKKLTGRRGTIQKTPMNEVVEVPQTIASRSEVKIPGGDLVVEYQNNEGDKYYDNMGRFEKTGTRLEEKEALRRIAQTKKEAEAYQKETPYEKTRAEEQYSRIRQEYDGLSRATTGTPLERSRHVSATLKNLKNSGYFEQRRMQRLVESGRMKNPPFARSGR